MKHITKYVVIIYNEDSKIFKIRLALNISNYAHTEYAKMIFRILEVISINNNQTIQNRLLQN